MRFTALIRIVNGNPYVDVPKKMPAVFGVKGYVKVLAKLRGVTHSHFRKLQTMNAGALKRGGYLAEKGWFRANFVPIGKGRHVLYLNGWMRNEARADVGDKVEVEIKADTVSRRLRMPPLLRDALTRDAKAMAAWKNRPESARRETIRYLLFLKSSEALERNVRKVIAALRGKTSVVFVRP
jgi:hypothetical protein